MRTLTALTLALVLTLGFSVTSFAEELGQQFWLYNEEKSMVTSEDEAVGQEIDKGKIEEESGLTLQSPDFLIN